METYSYTPKRVCARNITFSIKEGRLHDISFMGGCDGNLKAIGKLLEGADARKTVGMLKGNDCRGRGTSCADQLAQAIEEVI